MSTTNNGIVGETDHDYYCETHECGCKTFKFKSFKEFISAGNSRLFDIDREYGFYKRRIDFSNLILFRYDINEYYGEPFKLELHYGNKDEYSGLYHDVINITREDFPEVEKFLREAYKKLNASFKNESIIRDQPLYTDTCSFEKILTGDKGYSFAYNFPYHYQWYKDKNEKLCIIICFAGQRHGYSQWLARVENLSKQQEEQMKEFLETTVFNYVKKQWVEVAE